MRLITKRTVAISTAVAAFALIGSACSHTSSTSGTSTSTTTSVSTSATSSASPTTSAAATTTIPGANGTPYTVEGPILAKYQSLTADQLKDLGKPYDNEQKTKDGTGVYQQFDGGVLIYRTGGQVYFVWGKIRDAWNAVQASQGKLGYPTSDEQVLPDGSFKSTFEHGTITWKTGDAEATVTTS
jgi:uncharacterized protein with LGFP repeats